MSTYIAVPPRYWYFVFSYVDYKLGPGKEAVVIAGPGESEFKLSEITREVCKRYKTNCIIEYWHEISFDQYLLFNAMIRDLENPKKKKVFQLIPGGKKDEPTKPTP